MGKTIRQVTFELLRQLNITTVLVIPLDRRNFPEKLSGRFPLYPDTA